MDATTKAKELVDKFYSNPHRQESSAKECAIICCENIISELEQLRKPEYTTFVIRYSVSDEDEGEIMDGYEKIDFWNSVIEKIKSL